MDTVIWVGIVVAGLISVPAILYVVWPLLQPGPTLPLVDDDRLADLLMRKDTLLRAIKDLEFDHEMGKVSEEDYTRFAARLRRQAMGIMQQIDKVAPESAVLDTALEAEIARLRKVQSSGENGAAASTGAISPAAASVATGSLKTGAEETGALETGSADNGAPPLTAPEKIEADTGQLASEGKYCTQCGKPIGAGHKFCAHCGAPVHEVAH